jgi:hypothetical protein
MNKPSYEHAPALRVLSGWGELFETIRDRSQWALHDHTGELRSQFYEQIEVLDRFAQHLQNYEDTSDSFLEAIADIYWQLKTGPFAEIIKENQADQMPKNLESNESLFQWITMFYSIYRQFIEDNLAKAEFDSEFRTTIFRNVYDLFFVRQGSATVLNPIAYAVAASAYNDAFGDIKRAEQEAVREVERFMENMRTS